MRKTAAVLRSFAAIFVVVLSAGATNASTITVGLTETAGGGTLVGPVLSYSFGIGSFTFTQPLDALSPVIFQDLTTGKVVFEVDITNLSPPLLETLAFGDVLFTTVTQTISEETVSFHFAKVTITDTSATPLPAALPLFATGLGALGLLGWRRKRKAQAVA